MEEDQRAISWGSVRSSVFRRLIVPGFPAEWTELPLISNRSQIPRLFFMNIAQVVPLSFSTLPTF